MKYLLLLTAAIAFSIPSFSQKQLDETVLAELNFTPASDVPLSVEGIKLRIFREETFCIRTQFNVASSNVETVLHQPGELMEGETTNTDPVLETSKTFDFAIAPGVEYHMDGADRLSPYVGCYLLWGAGNQSTNTETWGAVDQNTADNPSTWTNWSTIETTPYRRIGFGAVTGADFYFADFIYLGVEFGLVFDRMNYKDTETTFSNFRGYQLQQNPGDPGTVEIPANRVNGAETSFGPSVNGAIRLGYCFGR